MGKIAWDDSISANFTWGEMVTASNPNILTARRKGLDADPYAQECVRLLVTGILQPLRETLGASITVTSGYRGPVPPWGLSSQHETGAAADIQVGDMQPQDLLENIRELVGRGTIAKPRQVIAETLGAESTLAGPMAKGSGRWVHIAILEPIGGPVESWARPAREGAHDRSHWAPSRAARVYIGG